MQRISHLNKHMHREAAYRSMSETFSLNEEIILLMIIDRWTI